MTMNPYGALLVLTKFFPSITCLSFISNYTQNPSLQIQLPDGLIQGKLKHTVDTDMPYYSYETIPYARPPVGALRFKAPQPPNTWDGILDASGDGVAPICHQIPPMPPIGTVREDEDCLYINVYVPKPSPESNEPKAVMVWIYGGAFLLGAGRSGLYGPDYLLEQDVIVVMFNYRLHVFGFMATGDLESPGNYGLKDQLAALKWVKSNIPLFGGDSNRITVFGESAGAASVQYHLVSPKSQNLFHLAISQSGSTLCPWALQRAPGPLAQYLGNVGGFFDRDSRSLVRFLRKKSGSELRDLAMRAMFLGGLKKDQSTLFLPVIEPDHEDAFITESTYMTLENKTFAKVPYIVGFNSEESGAALASLEFVKPLLKILPVPNEMLIPPSMNNKDPLIADEIKKFYFGDKSKSMSRQYTQFFSDTSFYRPIMESARLYSSAAPIYMYRFAYQGYNLGKKALMISEHQNTNGTTHAEELWYIFARKDLGEANETDVLVRKRLVTLWTNFAKYGNPTPKQDTLFQNVTWPKFQSGHSAYLNIDRKMTLENDFREDALTFWRDLFNKYGRPPYYTY